MADSFIAACSGGDLEALARMLHPDVSGWATVDGARVGFAEGVEACSERTLFFLGPRSGYLLLPLVLDDDIAVLATRDGEPALLLRAEVAGDRIRSLHAVLLPA